MEDKKELRKDDQKEMDKDSKKKSLEVSEEDMGMFSGGTDWASVFRSHVNPL